MAQLPKEMPNLQELLVDTDKVPWREKSLKGISEKMLWRNEETGASIALIRFAKGSGIPQPHYHASNQFMFCLSGKYEYTVDQDGAHRRQLLLQPEGQRARARGRARGHRGGRGL